MKATGMATNSYAVVLPAHLNPCCLENTYIWSLDNISNIKRGSLIYRAVTTYARYLKCHHVRGWRELIMQAGRQSGD